MAQLHCCVVTLGLSRFQQSVDPLLPEHKTSFLHHRYKIYRNVIVNKPADQRWMDKLAIEDGGAVRVRGEKVDQHDDLHLVVEGEPPV